MDRLAIIGVSGRQEGTDALEAWTAHAAMLEFGTLVPETVLECVPVQTCNRVEFVMALRENDSLEYVQMRLGMPEHPGHTLKGWAALEHLSRVAAGLDSLNPGEDQIQAQVRRALEAARAAGTVGPVVGFAFDAALRAAKRVRREVPLAPKHTSLFSLARPELEHLLPEHATIAVIGAGEMGTLAAKHLAERPNTRLLIANRNLERAEILAATCNAQAVSLEAFLNWSYEVDALVCATPVEHLIGTDVLGRHPHLRVIVDLGMPRNVNAIEARQAHVHLIDLERLHALGEARRETLEGLITQAERIVQQEINHAHGDWAERSLGAAIAHLRTLYLETIQRTVGERLTPEEAERLAHRFAHVPVKGLRGLVRQEGPDAAYAFLKAAGIGPADLELEPELVSHA